MQISRGGHQLAMAGALFKKKERPSNGRSLRDSLA
jgi:hypothetical protein